MAPLQHELVDNAAESGMSYSVSTCTRDPGTMWYAICCSSQVSTLGVDVHSLRTVFSSQLSKIMNERRSDIE